MARLAHDTVLVSGTGLFSGRSSSVRFAPARPGAGWTVVREDAGGGVRIGALVTHVTADTSWSGLPAGVPIRNTTLLGADAAGRPVAAATVEHVLSALAGLGVWDAAIHLEGVECPILDGSALGFVDALRGALEDLGTDPSPVPILLTRTIEVRDEKTGATITGEPLGVGESPSYTYDLDYGPESPLCPHRASWDLSAGMYAREVAPARTFSLHHEVAFARRVGLFAHASAGDLLVVGTDGLPIDNQWRFPDERSISTEPARHKLLDLIGDLALLGRPLRARVTASKSGHALTHQFCRAVAAAGGARPH